jgi:hypothetical protein
MEVGGRGQARGRGAGACARVLARRRVLLRRGGELRRKAADEEVPEAVTAGLSGWGGGWVEGENEERGAREDNTNKFVVDNNKCM